MMRRLLNLLTILSLLLCVAVVVMWVRGFFVSDRIARVHIVDPLRHGMMYQADFTRGMVWLERYDFRSSRDWKPLADVAPLLQPDVSGWHSYGSAPRSWTGARNQFSFHYEDHTDHPDRWLSERTRTLVVPLWPVAAVFAIAPVLFVRSHRRRRRKTREGKCARCGYDLRATREACPECGTIAAPLSRTG